MLNWSDPFDSQETKHVEVFNEMVTIGILYLLMLFTEFVDRPTERYNTGFAYLGLIGVYTLVHLGIILSDLFAKCKAQGKGFVAKRCKKKKARAEIYKPEAEKSCD